MKNNDWENGNLIFEDPMVIINNLIGNLNEALGSDLATHSTIRFLEKRAEKIAVEKEIQDTFSEITAHPDFVSLQYELSKEKNRHELEKMEMEKQITLLESKLNSFKSKSRNEQSAARKEIERLNKIIAEMPGATADGSDQARESAAPDRQLIESLREELDEANAQLAEAHDLIDKLDGKDNNSIITLRKADELEADCQYWRKAADRSRREKTEAQRALKEAKQKIAQLIIEAEKYYKLEKRNAVLVQSIKDAMGDSAFDWLLLKQQLDEKEFRLNAERQAVRDEYCRQKSEAERLLLEHRRLKAERWQLKIFVRKEIENDFRTDYYQLKEENKVLKESRATLAALLKQAKIKFE